MSILLVIEQDGDIRKLLTDTAKLSGYSAISSQNLEEARLKLERCSPTIVLASKELIYAQHLELINATDARKTTWLIFSSSWPLSVREEFQAQGCHTLYLDGEEISETLSSLSELPHLAIDNSALTLEQLRGDSDAMQRLKTQIKKYLLPH
ncbi:hypothetical protein L1889_02890 [Paenalcaligenes niemegkensis]|uniref:hypothetical protein n=1 Tax=Paenalcaligenes niemegkensis TaxID=2895469 RepID=UPI001EE7F724|nr:hypothetical protein [Paenalcaligenes niemegkensis]MCQ9615792.1 hypothetical protein [Paenalcaligenes niemegkensis]